MNNKPLTLDETMNQDFETTTSVSRVKAFYAAWIAESQSSFASLDDIVKAAKNIGIFPINGVESIAFTEATAEFTGEDQ